MSSVLHFRRQLFTPPDVAEVPGICVRFFGGAENIAGWLSLRERAMADQVPRARAWSESDFRSEMLSKSWWCADHCWLAEESDKQGSLVGAVTLAIREGATSVVPVVHWLLVDPAWRRRGVGRLLMSHLEVAVWNNGWRQVELETHAEWAAAVGFYQSMGYAVRDRSPR